MKNKSFLWILLISFVLISCNSKSTQIEQTVLATSTLQSNQSQTETEQYQIATPYVLPTHTQSAISTRHGKLSTFDLDIPSQPFIFEENYLRVKEGAYIDFDQFTSFAIPNEYFDWIGEEREIDMSTWNLANGTMDIQFLIVDNDGETSIFIDPWNNNLIGTLQTDQENSYENCLYAPKQYGGFTYALTESIPTFCIKTSSENIASFQIISITKINSQDPSSLYQIGFTYKLWNEDGKNYPNQIAINLEDHLEQTPQYLELDRNDTVRIPDIDIKTSDIELSIQPINNAMLSRWRGDKIPTYALCQSSSYSSDKIAYPIEENTLLFACYKTSQGKIGRIMFTGQTIDQAQPLSQRQFKVNFETWGVDSILQNTTSIAQVYLTYGDAFDLDKGSFISPSTQMEFRLYQDLENTLYLMPNTQSTQVAFANIGKIKDPINKCQQAQYSNIPIVLESLNPNDIVCFKTDLGRNGFIEIESITTQPNHPEVASLSFQYLLFDQETNKNILNPQIYAYFDQYISQIPVDIEQLGSAGTQDFGIRKNTQNEIVLYPVSGTKIVYWGETNPTYQDCQSTNITTSISTTEINVHPKWQSDLSKTYFCIITAENNWGKISYSGKLGDQFLIQAELWQLK